MKRSEKEELKRKSVAELQKLLQEKREELRTLRFDIAAGKVKNLFLLRDTKKTIARILTLLRQHEGAVRDKTAAKKK
ncbi:50S ribosomal protein L29 [Candidatus Parcubacteria bacterium]|nr:MAG: 50S ribosomal protein L29 [Candidatus Parcubacteria bacterium]